MIKQPTWITGAYKSTEVHWAKSQAKIMEMLGQVGIDQIRFTNMPDRFVLEFMAQIDNGIPRAIRIISPLKTKVTDDPKIRNKELNTVHRILLAHLKAKFIAIGTGLAEFESEFMSHLVVTDKNGQSSTMGEQVLPQYRKNLESGTSKPFQLGDGSN